jgi:hypothetical protein
MNWKAAVPNGSLKVSVDKKQARRDDRRSEGQEQFYMPIDKFKNLTASDLDKVVWRYLTFPKYISLLTYGALWFSKLNILTDEYEGHMPTKTDAEMRAATNALKFNLPPELRDQLAGTNRRNVEDGRELTAVICWFLDNNESKKMWVEYSAASEGVAIKSTIRQLSQYVYCEPQYTVIGRVKYVDLDAHTMSHYEANQAHERAFLKRLEYEHENEVRIVTLNFRGPMCVSMEGESLTPSEYQGAGMNNFENPGLYIRSNLQKLITATVLAPGASTWFELLVKKIVRLSNVGEPVERSGLEE